VAAYWAFRESSLDNRAVGDGGRSFGIWQQRVCGRSPIATQAACWVALLHEGQKRCAEPSAIMWGICDGATAKLAAQRVAKARSLLARVTGAEGRE